MDANLQTVRKSLPADLVLARTSDQPLQVHDSIELFSHSLVEALVLVVIVALIGFWSWRTSLLIAVSIPITLAIAFDVINTLGIDLQQVSIASLIIASRMWHLMLRSAERRMRTPWFVREWEHLRSEFESFPEFVELVTSVQRGASN